jgi:hypothetical protein
MVERRRRRTCRLPDSLIRATRFNPIRVISQKGYAEKYLGQGSDVHLIGVEFSKTARNVVGFEVQTVTQ